MQYHIDGELVPAADAVISVTDHGFRYGDAAVERLRVYNGSVFEWGAHADRFETTASTIGLGDHLHRTEWLDRIQETLSANDLEDGVVELTITRGSGAPGETLGPTTQPTVVVTVEPAPSIGTAPESATLQTVRTRHIPTECLPGEGCRLDRLQAAWAQRELASMAVDDPADEAVIRDLDGNVVGGARSAIGFVTDSGLHSPAIEGRHPADIRLDLVLDAARDEDIPVHRGEYDRDDLQSASELFVLDTVWGIRPVETVDGVTVGGGPVTALLRRRFQNNVRNQCY